MDIGGAKKCIADLKQQLMIADTRCGSLKSQLDYMKMLYHDVHPETEEIKRIDTPQIHDSLSRKSTMISPKIEVCDIKSTDSEGMKLYNYSEDVDEIQCAPKNDIVKTPRYSTGMSPKLSSNLSERSTRYNEAKSIEKSMMDAKDTEVNVITPRAYILPQGSCYSTKAESSIHEESTIDYDNWKNIYQNYLVEDSVDIHDDARDSKKSFEKLITENENKYLYDELTFLKEDIKRNISGSARDARMATQKFDVKSEKDRGIVSMSSSKKGSSCKVDDTVSLKLKRRKAKLRGSNSKSTVTTKDTSLIRRKDIKKRKQKGVGSNRYASVLKPRQAPNDVVEIYHNIAAKSRTSIISNKQVKLDRRGNKGCLVLSRHQNMHSKLKCDGNNSQQKTNQGPEPNTPHESLHSKRSIELRTTNDSNEGCKLEKMSTLVCATDNYYQHATNPGSYCNSMTAHNYEMPTLASKLKRANRSYFSRFNFRNIPFVVGTSVTPSHNLGLNIQQVLSIMKTRQPTVNGITPLLIRKVSRGIKPVSILMEQINDQCKLSDINSRTISLSGPKENMMENDSLSLQFERSVLSNQTLKLNSSNMKQYHNIELTRTKNQPTSENQMNKYEQSSCAFLGNKNAEDIKTLKSFTSQQDMKSQAEYSKTLLTAHQDSVCNEDFYDGNSISHSRSSRGIREVLINLHDQFEEMNIKYEKLQARAEKSSNKALESEIQVLEKELTAKEDEINAVVSLYKEVMALKHQMKVLQEKNSFVCISTEVRRDPTKIYPSVPLTLTKSYGTNLHQGFHGKKTTSFPAATEPSTSIRLAGLLRQIQTFQKQLKLAS